MHRPGDTAPIQPNESAIYNFKYLYHNQLGCWGFKGIYYFIKGEIFEYCRLLSQDVIGG